VWGSGPCLASGKVDAIFLLPRLVDELAQLRVVDIAAGDTHCLALTHDNEVCYSLLLGLCDEAYRLFFCGIIIYVFSPQIMKSRVE
jgi:hypothetical protein